MTEDAIDWEHVSKVCIGDPDAFRFVVNKYKDVLFTYAYTILKDHQLAEEAVQDAFLNAFRYLNTFRRKSTFKTWLIRIQINEANKKRKQTRTAVILKETFTDSELNMSNSIDVDDEVETIKHALCIIAADKSLALRLFYLDGYSKKEIAELTNWSAAKTKVTLHRAKAEMLRTVEALRSKIM